MSYTSGIINIPNVTGNIVITATATQASVSSISAVFVQGQNIIYDTDSLDTLRQYLTVTATYSDSSTAAVTNYTLSGTLAEGTSTITVSYGGQTDTFDVTVSQDLQGLLYSFDFRNNNLTDAVNGVVAVTTATQTASGISFTAGSQYIVLDTTTTHSLAGLRVEIDIASMSDSSDTSGNYHARLFSVTTNTSYATHNGADNFLWRKGGIGWYFYNGSWSTEYIDPVSYPGSYFSGKTVVLEFDASGYCTVSVNGVDLITYTIASSRTGYFVIGGSNSDYMTILSPTISGVRVYEVTA